MSKSNTLFQHPVYVATNSINDLRTKYEDYDVDNLNEDEVNQDIEVLDYLYHNLDDFIKKPSYEQLKKQMNNALEGLAEKQTEYYRGTEY